MKKKSLILLAGGLLIAVALRAAIVYSGFLVNEPALAYSKNFTLDLKTGGTNHRAITSVAATASISSSTVPSVTFTDGGLASGTITVLSTSSLTGVKATDQITITSTSTLKNAVLFVTGSNGVAVRLRAFYDWKVGSSTSTTATNIAAIINRIPGIQASAAVNVVYATATAAGTGGNSYAISKQSASGLTIASALFTGGVDDAYVQIGTQRLTRGTAWSVGSSTADTAGNIATAVRANSTLNSLVTVSTSASAVMTITAQAVGTAGNLSLAVFPSSITTSGAAMTSGTDAAWSLNSATIHKTSHGLYTGLGVLYSTGTLAISGLTNQTTYYAIRVDADNFKLASSTTNAVAGTGIVLASTSTAGPHTYTLAPLATAGTWGFKWQTSDDNVTYTDVSVSSVTFPSPYTAATASWDFGAVGHRYLRVNEAAGTAGAINIQVAVTGRSDN